ncbi:MAG: hypothetical protein WC473_02700 [Patescibacteria group bacterium]
MPLFTFMGVLAVMFIGSFFPRTVGTILLAVVTTNMTCFNGFFTIIFFIFAIGFSFIFDIGDESYKKIF